MNPIVKDFIHYIQEVMPKDNKKRAQEETQKHFNMTKDGTVFYTEHLQLDFANLRKEVSQIPYLHCLNFKSLTTSLSLSYS